MAENSRETRRRRILERGSDRLAFITGRVQSLPPPGADANSSSQSYDPNTNLPTVLPHDEAVQESDSTLINHDPPVANNPHHSDASRSITQIQPLHEHEDDNEISSVPTSELDHVQPPPPDASLDISNQQPQLTQEPKHFIIPSEISSAINASRTTRLCCSVAVALLVVVSYLGFSLMGGKLFNSVISFRPLYLVLVTNLTVVVARLISSDKRRLNITSSGGDQWDAQLARTLELGLVMQNVADAVFMDCAVYAIVVICGVSLVQT